MNWPHRRICGTIMALTALIIVVCSLAGCGDDFASYDKPADSSLETEWHRCMRQSAPIGRSAKCADLK